MNPVVFEFGTLEIRSYTAWLSGGILLALAMIAWRAYRTDPAGVVRQIISVAESAATR